jgi:poly(3-hydroxybutyrate) depolymerase
MIAAVALLSGGCGSDDPELFDASSPVQVPLGDANVNPSGDASSIFGNDAAAAPDSGFGPVFRADGGANAGGFPGPGSDGGMNPRADAGRDGGGAAPDGGSDAGGMGSDGGAAAPGMSAGCGKMPTLTSGMRSIQSGGKNRTFILRIPENYDRSKPYRLIFGFHWRGGTANDVDSGGTSGFTWSYYGLREQANNSTIFVAPQGNGNGWANPNNEDLTFVDDMVKLIQGDLCVDTTRLFALGFSYGGGMSYAVACGRPTVFRAVAVYSGSELSGCTGGTQPVAYMGLHGLRDPTLNISFGRAMRDKFVRNNGCTAQSPMEPSQGSLTHTCTSYAGCSSGHPVRWCAFDSGHTPAPLEGTTEGSGGGDKTWTKGEVWKFFTQF